MLLHAESIGILYCKCSKILNTFLFLFSNIMLVIRAGTHRISNRVISLLWVCIVCLDLYCTKLVYKILEHLPSSYFFMPPKELWEAYSNRTVRPSVPLRVRCISPIFFEVGIPNLVCGCILGWRSVAYHFRVTVTLTLTSDLVFRIIVSGAYLLYYLR